MRKAKALPVQLDTPLAKAQARQEKTKRAKKTKKWSQLSGAEKDEVLCAFAIQAGLIEEE